MKLTFLKNLAFTAAFFAIFAAPVIGYLVIGPALTAHAGAGDLPGTVATTSVATVTTTASTIFATSTCGARVITTTASPIMLTFSDNQGAVPTGAFGTLQAASTTVAYSNSLYGCGAYKAYSFVSGPITVMESR